MSVTTTTKSYRGPYEGKGWKMYSDIAFKDCLIVYELHGHCLENPELSFEELHESLKEYYAKKKVRSCCRISKTDDRIEILKRGGFPRFYILNTNIND